MAETQKPDQNEAKKQPHFACNGQYIKDISFENPNAPHSFTQQEKPQIKVNVDLKAQKIQESLYEVSMQVEVKADAGETAIFLVELTYAGLFTLENIPENALEPVLLVECPTLLFPYARRVVSDTIRDGGYPPLMLDLIDFGGLYRQQKMQQQKDTGQKAAS